MHRSFSIVVLSALGVLAMACSDTSTNPRLIQRAVASGGKSVTIDALVVKNGQIVTGTSAGEVQAFAVVNGNPPTLLGAEVAKTFQTMSVTVPQGASLELKVLPFANTTLITWLEGPEASGPELSMANPYTVPFGSLLSNYTADCALGSASGGGGGGGGGIH